MHREYVEKVHRTLGILLVHAVQRPLAMHHRLLQAVAPALAGLIRHQRIVHLMPGAQYGLLVGNARLLLAPFLQLQGPLQTPALEHRYAQARAECKIARAPTAQIRQLRGLKTDTAGQGNPRIEVRLGHADRCSGCMQSGLGTTNIGPPLRQFAGQTDRHIGAIGRHPCRCAQLRLQGSWLAGQQQAESIDQLCTALLQGGLTCFDLGHLGASFRHLQIRSHALPQLQPGQLQAAAGDLQVLLHHGQCLLSAAQLNIVLRGLHDHQQLHRVTVLHRHLYRGISRFHRTLDPAPEVSLPTEPKATIPQVESLLATVPGRVTQTFLAVTAPTVSRRCTDLGQGVGVDLTADSQALLQAACSQLHIKVALLRLAHQRRQLPVAETVPPVQVHRCLQRMVVPRLSGYRRPVRRQLGHGSLEVRADHATTQAQYAVTGHSQGHCSFVHRVLTC